MIFDMYLMFNFDVSQFCILMHNVYMIFENACMFFRYDFFTYLEATRAPKAAPHDLEAAHARGHPRPSPEADPFTKTRGRPPASKGSRGRPRLRGPSRPLYPTLKASCCKAPSSRYRATRPYHPTPTLRHRAPRPPPLSPGITP